MIETKIDELIKAINALTAAIQNQPVAQVNPAPVMSPEGLVLLQGHKPEEMSDVPFDPADEVVEVVEEVTPITHDGVQALCMMVVRSDRDKKQLVKDAIASFGGATVLKDVPEADLPALKAKLEAI